MAYGGAVEPLAKEKHQLGEGCFDRGVASADDAGIEELAPCLIETHLDAARAALGDVDDGLA